MVVDEGNLLRCLKKNLNASRPSEHLPVREENVRTFRWDHRLQNYYNVVVVSHIQRTYWLPTRKKLIYTVANPTRDLLNRESRTKIYSLAASPPPPHAARSEKTKQKSRDASTYLGATQVSVRLAPVQDSSARRLGQWVSLLKVLRFRVR